MPRSSNTYAHYRCDHCGQGFQTQTAIRRHIGHLPRCQAAALRRSGGEQLAINNEGLGQEIEDDIADTHSEPADSMAGQEPDLDNRRNEGNQEGQDAGPARYAREYDQGLAAEVLGSAKTAFEVMKDYQESSGCGAYAPFADHEEWELAEWLVRNVNQRATEEFLKLSIVSLFVPDDFVLTIVSCRPATEHNRHIEVNICS